MKIASYIYTSNTSPADVSQLWIKPEDGGNATLHVFTNGKWVPLGGVGESAYEAAVKAGFEGSKEEWLESLALKYSDLTAEQKADLAKDAVSAAERAAQAVENIENTINDIDVSSTDGAITALAAKQGLLENELTALGPKIEQITATEKVAIVPTGNYTVGAMVGSGNSVVPNTTSTWNSYVIIGTTAPIHLKEGDSVFINNGNSTYISTSASAITKVTGFGTNEVSYQSLVQGNGSKKYSYTAEEEIDILITCYANIRTASYVSRNDKSAGANAFVKNCILTEAYTVTSCTRDADGNVSSADIVFPDGITGSVTITRDSNGDVSSAVFAYGTESYTLTITRDANGNVLSSEIN